MGANTIEGRKGSTNGSGNNQATGASDTGEKTPLLRWPDTAGVDDEIPERKGDTPAKTVIDFPPDNPVKCQNLKGCVPEATPTIYDGPFKNYVPHLLKPNASGASGKNASFSDPIISDV